MLQNGSTAKDVAYQQGFQAVAELLGEYECRLMERKQSEDLTISSDKMEDQREENGEMGRGMKSCPANPSHQDVIPSPKHSPHKTKAGPDDPGL